MNNNSKIVFSTKQFNISPSLSNIIDIPSHCFTAKMKLRKLYKYFNNNKYKQGYDLLDKLYNTDEKKYFKIPKEDLKYILKVIRIRYLLKKLVFKWRCNILKKNEKTINDITLNLEPLSSIDKDDLIKIYNKHSNTSYKFYYKYLINTFRMYLENANYGITKPKALINPYTNEKLTLEQNIAVFEQIKNITQKKNEHLPILLRLYTKYYNVKQFKRIHYKFLSSMACSNYIKDLDEEIFDKLLSDYIQDYYRDKVCFKCIIKIKNYRTVFEPILINYINYSNHVSNICNFIKMTDSIIKNYKILDINSREHKSLHREKIVANRRLNRRLNRRPRYNFSANRIHENNLLRERRIMYHLSNLENEIIRRRQQRRSTRNQHIPPLPEYESPPPLPEYVSPPSFTESPQLLSLPNVETSLQTNTTFSQTPPRQDNISFDNNVLNQYLDTLALINVLEEQMAEDE